MRRGTKFAQPQYLALLRHGETEVTSQIKEEVAAGQQTNALYYSHTGSDRHVPLTPVGRSEVQKTAREKIARLFPADFPVKELHLANFRRLHESAEIVQETLPYSFPIIPDRRLEKRSYGQFWNVTYKGVRELFPDQYALFQKQGPWHYTPPDGENYPTFLRRVNEFIQEKINNRQIHKWGNKLIITSSAVIYAFVRRLEGLTNKQYLRLYERMALPTGGLFIYRRLGPSYPWQPVLL